MSDIRLLPLLLLLGCPPVLVGGDGPLRLDDTGPSADGGAAGDGGLADGGGSDGGVTDGGTAAGTESVYSLRLVEHDQVATMLELSWTQSIGVDAAWVTYSFEDQVLTSPVVARGAGSHTEVLLGIPPETDVSATLTVELGDASLTSAVLSAQTGQLPRDLDVPDLVQWDQAAASEHRYALTAVDVGSYDFYGPFYVVILDRNSRVVWYESVDDSRLTWQPRISLDGTHLLYEASTYYTYGAGVKPSIKRLTLDKSQQDDTVIEGMGLAWSEMPDGSYVFDHAETGYEYHLERLYADGERERIWSCYPWMSEYDRGYWACAPNAVVVDHDRNTALYSMFETSTVVEIDLDSGEMVRQMGQLPDGWDFDPVDSTFDLQHYPNWTPEGTLLVSTHPSTGGGSRQYVREYRVDDATDTLEQIWSYLEPSGYYAQYAGGALRIDNGNTMITVGTDGAVLEITPEGDIVWELDWHGHLVGNVTAIDDLYALNEGW